LKLQTVTSRDNPQLKRARAVRDGKNRELIFVEGLRLCEEALNSGLSIQEVIFSNQIAEKPRANKFLNAVEPVAERLISVSEALLGTISYTKTPQGIILLAGRPPSGKDLLVLDAPGPPLLVVLHSINNPVNVGAILRTAEAAGSSGAIATEQSSDPFSPKALRGAMGSAFRLPLWFGATFEEVIEWCERRGVQTLCADARGAKTFTEVDWKRPTALILGPESKGFATDELKAASQTVAIPMAGNVESLNVAVTAGVLLYEARKQRQP
jgi:TrmH family RNA methyltransferase